MDGRRAVSSSAHPFSPPLSSHLFCSCVFLIATISFLFSLLFYFVVPMSVPSAASLPSSSALPGTNIPLTHTQCLFPPLSSPLLTHSHSFSLILTHTNSFLLISILSHPLLTYFHSSSPRSSSPSLSLPHTLVHFIVISSSFHSFPCSLALLPPFSTSHLPSLSLPLVSCSPFPPSAVGTGSLHAMQWSPESCREHAFSLSYARMHFSRSSLGLRWQ